jgi:pyruvate/2-oxoglutarate dehydrogenase complex dihydrolipoamide dehydrogenase (E3) component/cytochrome c biogenesis protein CcdA
MMLVPGLDAGSLTLALGAGLVAAVNPCGFALLPAYLSLFVLGDAPRSRTAAVGRALRATTALTLGFAGVFVGFGLAIAPVAASVQSFLPAFTVALGLLLALAGLWLLAGRGLPSLPIPRRRKAATASPVVANWPAMMGFGASYAVASLGCTIAPFLAVVVTSFRSGSPGAGVVLFAAYAAGMGLTVAVAATAVALARRGLVTSMRRAGSIVPRLGGLVLAAAGGYVAWYGAWELRVLHGGAGTDPVVSTAAGVQEWLATRTAAIGVIGLALVLTALLASHSFRAAAPQATRHHHAHPTPNPACPPHKGQPHAGSSNEDAGHFQWRCDRRERRHDRRGGQPLLPRGVFEQGVLHPHQQPHNMPLEGHGFLLHRRRRWRGQCRRRVVLPQALTTGPQGEGTRRLLAWRRGPSRARTAGQPMTAPLETPASGLVAEVVVVGMGVGGESVGGQLAAAGLDVIGIEAELVGGECPYWGCIPTKMMIRAGNLLAEARRIPGMAGHLEGLTPDWTPVADRIRAEATDNWDDKVAVDRFTGKGGRFVRGKATILGPRQVPVAGVGVIEARRALVIATGTTAAIPPIPGLAETPYWTNRDAVSVEELPASMAVIGAGAVGCEIGQTFARFGAEVTIIEAADQPLPAEEPEAGELIAGALAEDGVRLVLGAQISRVEHDDDQFLIHVEGRTEPVVAERLLVATGRRPQLTAEERQALGLTSQQGPMPVDENLRVTDGVWAVGDITGHGAFTHVATYQADLAVRDILQQPGEGADYSAVPRVTFADPEVGAVGLTEAQARERGLNVITGTAQVPSSARGWLHKAGNHGFIKLVVDTDTDLLVGATSAGPAGGEVLAALAVAVHAWVPAAVLEQMIYAYPTFHRGIQDALRNLREQQP